MRDLYLTVSQNHGLAQPPENLLYRKKIKSKGIKIHQNLLKIKFKRREQLVINLKWTKFT